MIKILKWVAAGSLFGALFFIILVGALPVEASQLRTIEPDCEPGIVRYVTDAERNILYRIAWAEARGEDDKGIILVVNVIFNRMGCPSFPDTIQEVVFAPRQFSPITNGAFARATPCERIKGLVQQAIDGADHSYGATFFRTVAGSAGSWHERALNRIFTHGAHHFYVAR